MDPDYVAMLEAQLTRSAELSEAPLDWWTRAHANDAAYWLSGTPGPEVWERLGILDRLQPGEVVLNIGVGMGHCTHALVERGCSVSVLDISQVALDRVASIADGYRADALPTLPSARFDVALSHLVAQHMSNADLARQVSHVVRSLKPGGVFAMQYSIGEDGEEVDDKDLQRIKSGSVRRTVESLNALVERAGGRVLRTLERESHPCGTVWRVAHIASGAG